MLDGSFEPKLEMPPSENEYEKRWLGEFVVIYPRGISNIFMGKVKSVDRTGKCTLNPFVGTDYSTGIPLKVLKEKDSSADLSEGFVEPETEENLRAYCNFLNKHAKANDLEEKVVKDNPK